MKKGKGNFFLRILHSGVVLPFILVATAVVLVPNAIALAIELIGRFLGL